MSAAPDQLRRFLQMLTDVRYPAADVEEFRLACRTLQNVLPKQQKEFARSIGVSGFHVWGACNIAMVACAAFDMLESRGLAPTKENFRIIRNEGRKAREEAAPKDLASNASLGASLVLGGVESWSNRGCCRISDREKLKLPWRLRLLMATPAWANEARGRMRWMMFRIRNRCF